MNSQQSYRPKRRKAPRPPSLLRQRRAACLGTAVLSFAGNLSVFGAYTACRLVVLERMAAGRGFKAAVAAANRTMA